MARRKHTRCAACSTVGMYWYYEIQWRRTCDVIWWWAGGWMCAACWTALRSNVEQLRAGLLAIDG